MSLPVATEFVSTYNGAAQTATTITVGGADASFDLNATGSTGTVTITSTGAVNLDKITTAVALNVNATEISAIGLITIAGATTLSATTVDLSALKTTTASLTLVGPTAVSLPELTTLGGGFVAEQAESFSTSRKCAQLVDHRFLDWTKGFGSIDHYARSTQRCPKWGSLC